MPRFFHALHLPLFCVDDSKQLGTLLGIRVINDWVAKFIGFFVPVLLFDLGRNLGFSFLASFSSFQKGILLLAGYSIALRLIILFLALPLGRLVAAQGSRTSLLLNLFFQAGYFLFLAFSQQQIGFLLPAVLFQAVHIFLFNTLYLTLFAKFSLKKHIGENLSLSEFLLQLISIAVPALGGLIIVQFGYELLFMCGLLGIAVTFLLTLISEPVKFSAAPNWPEFQRWLKVRSYRRIALSYVGRYINDAAIGLWPVYVLLFVGTIEKVGFAYSLSLFFSMLIIFFSGLYVDHKKNKRPYLLSGGILSSLWVLRMMVSNIATAILVDTLDKLTATFHWLFFDAMTIKSSRGEKALSLFTYREVVMSVGGMIFWLAIILIFMAPASWYGLFALGGIGVFLTLFMNDQNKDLMSL